MECKNLESSDGVKGAGGASPGGLGGGGIWCMSWNGLQMDTSCEYGEAGLTDKSSKPEVLRHRLGHGWI